MTRHSSRRFIFGIATAAISLTLAAPASAGAVKPESVLARAKMAIAAQRGVHVVFAAHSGTSSVTEKIIADVGTTTGTETVFEGSAELAIRVTGAFAYVSGDRAGFTTLFGLSSADAKKVGKRWESWKAGTKQYANLASDVTMSSVTGLLPKAAGTRLSTGAETYVLKWRTAATKSIPKLTVSLTISAESNLPLKALSTSPTGTSASTALSHWGEDFSIKPPPATSIVGSSQITG
jgi:poly-gamma-glutamate capsule biosynthesis protein CapA/YwtB (metallophosphatase superfamily)